MAKSPAAGQVRIQIHTDTISAKDLAALRTECERLATRLNGALGVRFEEGEDGGSYMNVAVGSHDPQDLWPHINAELYQSPIFGPALRARSMALRTGVDGWNDYVLLYHFDPLVPVEQQH